MLGDLMRFDTARYKISCVTDTPAASIQEMTAFCSWGLVVCSPSFSFQSFPVLDHKTINFSPVSQNQVAGSASFSTLIPLGFLLA